MFTLGFRFKPWESAQSIADGASIKAYIKEAASENGIDQHIRYRQKVVAADWSDADNRWTVTVESDGKQTEISCSFLFACSGYYNYDEGYSPTFEGAEDFQGTIIHPQHWPEDLELRGQEGRGHRIRRDRGDAHSGLGELRRRPRHHAAALADLYRLAAADRSCR